MLNNDIIANFLGLCNVTFDKICKKDDFIKISLSAAPESQICPCCKNKTSRIHDYRLREVKLPEIAEKLILGKFIFENHTPTFDKEPIYAICFTDPSRDRLHQPDARQD